MGETGVGLDSGCQAKAVELRHHHIRDDDINGATLQERPGLLSIRRGGDDVVVVQEFAEVAEHFRTVVYQQYSGSQGVFRMRLLAGSVVRRRSVVATARVAVVETRVALLG